MPITISNIKEAILFKSIGTDPMEDLLETMKTDYAKKLLADNSWPDGVRKEFMSNLHQFMAFLNVSTYEARGQTYLYIPEEDLNDEDAASKDKDLLQRLESTVIQWTRQIKDLVSNQDSPSGHSDDSPLDEIAYWKKRTANLNVLNQRLKMKELKQIISVLEAANSSYLEQFQALEKKIKIGFEESQDNLQFLNTLDEPCRKIDQAKPKDIPKILPQALNCVRIIFELSQHYGTMERMKSLLTKISNQIIKQCRAKINKDDMLSGDVEKCMDDL
jgi:dynein heavy chain